MSSRILNFVDVVFEDILLVVIFGEMGVWIILEGIDVVLVYGLDDIVDLKYFGIWLGLLLFMCGFYLMMYV